MFAQRIETQLVENCVRRASRIRLGLALDRNTGIRILPEFQEILISRFGLGGVALQGVSASEAELSERTDGLRLHNAAMREKLLKFAAA